MCHSVTQTGCRFVWYGFHNADLQISVVFLPAHGVCVTHDVFSSRGQMRHPTKRICVAAKGHYQVDP